MRQESISSPGRHHAGAMTAPMRAIAPGPRCLRVAVVREGRIVEERRVRRRNALSFGTSERADLVVHGRGVPPCAVLFEPHADEHVLLLPENARVRVARGAGIEELRGPRRIELGRDARGKLTLGDTSILFQLAPEPPVPVKPALPRVVLQNALSVEWDTSVIAAFSFLLHFLFAGALYSEWLDPALDDGVRVSGLVESLASLPKPPDVEDPTPANEVQAPTTRTTTTPREPTGSDTRRGSETVTPSNGDAALRNELDRIELLNIGALTGKGPATKDVLRDGDVPTGALDEAARSDKGVSGPEGLKLARGGPLRPGTNALSDLAGNRRVETHDTGLIEKPKGPRGTVSQAAPNVHGTVSDAARVVAGMRPGFRACYQRAIDGYPDAQGRISLSISVGPNGEVQSVRAAPSGNLPASMVACVRARASAGQFSPPEGGSAVVDVPVIFIPGAN